MSKEVKRFYIMPGSVPALLSGDPAYTPMTNHLTDVHTVPLVLASDYDALLAERDRLRNDHGSMRNALKNARYRIEQGRVWNGMGWTLTGLHAHQQQKALDEIDAALQGAQP